MKNRYLFKSLGFIFILGLLFSALNVQAQNRNYLDFDGSNDYVKYTDDATLGRMDGATDYTIEAWIYPVAADVAEYDYFINRYYTFKLEIWKVNTEDNTCDWWFGISTDGSGDKDSYTNYNTVGDATLNLDTWNHVAVIKNSTDGTLKLFVNGTDVTDNTNNPAPINLHSSVSSDNLYIGSKGTSSNNFGGYIDEVHLKNVAVSPSALRHNIYDNQYSSDANTAALFHFNEGSGTNTVNEASNTNATLYNGAIWRDWDYSASNHLPLAHEWTGTTTDWGTAGNWDGGVPASTNDVIIPLLSSDPEISTSTTADCHNLLIESSATLTIKSSSSGTGSLIISGDFTNDGGTVDVERYMTSYSSVDNGWHFLSSPVSSFTIAGSAFEPTSGDDDLYEYDETATTDNWLNYTGGSFGDTEFQVGKGYLVAYKTADTNQFTGDLNTGSHSVNLSYTSGAASPGWNLLGNPYTSAIDWDLLTKTASVDGSVYVLRASDGAYISWNGSTGDLTDGIIPAMQGYFVKATATSQSVTMEAADQVHATGSYYKSSEEQNTLIVKVTGEKGSSSAYIQFRDDATKTFDHAIDAYKLFGFSSAPQVYTNDGENIYSINCLPDNLKDYWLPLAIKTDYPGEYTLNFSGLDNIGNNLKVKLKDLKLNATVNLSEGDNYSFVYSEGDDINRFELEFYSVTGINNTTVSDNSIVIYTSNSELIIRNTDNKSLTGKVSILNLLGQIVYSDNLNGSSSQTINTGLKQGVYIVHLTQNSGASVSRKIMIR